MKVAAAGMGLLLVILSIAIYRQHEKHVARLERIERSIAFDRKYEATFTSWLSSIDPTIDAWNHARNDLRDSMESMNNVGDVVTMETKVRHLSFEQHRLDHAVTQDEAAVRDFLNSWELGRKNREARFALGRFEQYWRSSDRLNDAATSLHGIIRVAFSMPFAAAAFGDSASVGRNFAEATFRFQHNFQAIVIVNERNAALDDLRRFRKQDERRLQNENAHWLFAGATAAVTK